MCIICQIKASLEKHGVSEAARNEITDPINGLLIKVNDMLEALHDFHETLPNGLDHKTMQAVQKVEAYFAPPQEPTMLEALVAEMEAIGIPVKVIRSEEDAEAFARYTESLKRDEMKDVKIVDVNNLANWTPPEDKKAN